MKRQKTFFTSKEIAHVWAHQGAPLGRSPGNMAFNAAAQIEIIFGYRIEARFSIDDGRTWKHGGWNTVRDTWFPLTEKGLAEATATANAIVNTLQDSNKLAVVINEADEAAQVGCIEYSAQFQTE